jgi:ketosteroid isomerase-like protein
MMRAVKYTILFLALSTFVFAADKSASEEQAVRATVQQFNDAARSGDEATLNKLLSPDLIYVHSSAKMENKAECIAALVKGKPDFQLAPGAHVNLYGNTAVVHGRMVANVTQNGSPAKLELDHLQVWVKSGKNWQMVARHTSRVQPAS